MHYNYGVYLYVEREGRESCGARLLMMKRVIRWILLLITVLALAGIPALAEQADAALPEATDMPPAAEPEPTAIPEPTAAPEPQIRFTRDLSGSYAEYGNKITISYTVRNEGPVPVENIVITDGPVGEVGRIERLEPGERKTMSAGVRITQTCTSAPSITYEYGGRSYSDERSAQQVYVADVRVRVELSADKTNVAPGEMVTLRLNVVNEGNVSLYGLRASEPVLGDLGSVVSALKPGDESVITRTVQMKSTNTFQFAIEGSSDAGGTVSAQSNEMSVLVTPVAAQILLSLRAEADRTELTGPGEVVFSLYVSNDCSLELRNVELFEETRGKIRDLVFVPTGEMPVITESYEVTESGSYCFQARVTDSVGDRMTVYSEPIEITLQEAGAPSGQPTIEPAESSPQETAIPVLDGAPYRMEGDPATFEKLMFGAALALLAILLIWYMASAIRRRLERRRRARRRKQKKNKRAKGKKRGK